LVDSMMIVMKRRLDSDSSGGDDKFFASIFRAC
jgi:hypothetical protein